MLEGTLVSIHSPQEYGFLQQLTTTNGQSSAWIGGFYLQYEWLWLDGSWFFNNTNSWSVQNQFSSNPCLQFNTNEGLSNVPCNVEEISAICAKDSNVPQGITCPDGWSSFMGRCYYFQSEDMTWRQADTNCATLEASLVSIHSRQEYAFLQQMNSSTAWLGGIFFQNQWMWLDGSLLYQGFFTDMSYPNSEFACLGINNNDGWSNYGCDNYFASICVKDGI
ncbi:rheacalcin-1-like [Genypterus blacodes]|uniref:rheacalcin-1-like n=1 Tax=Genypterus blacodes TaxID=154954 RepID=UPI003F76A1E4